jgi:ABC-type glycerol-3-phosphate transport system permease component
MEQGESLMTPSLEKRNQPTPSGGRKKIQWELLVLYVVLSIFALCYVIPFLWLLVNSLKTPSELFAHPVQWIPAQLQWVNFQRVFTSFPFFLYLENTLIIVTANIVGSVLSNSLIGYGFSRLEWKNRDKVFLVVLVTMILPFQVVMIPLFLLFQNFHWIGTFLPLTATAFFGNPFFIFLFRQFFLGIPKELSEAAKMDGASEFLIYSRVIIPLSTPVIATVIIFAFLRTWNDFIGPLIFLSDDKLYTLALGAQQIMTAYDPRWELLMALGVTMTLPVLVLFFLLQRYFIQGIAMTGIKG